MLGAGDYTISLGQMRGVPLRQCLPAVAKAGFSGFVLGIDAYLAARASGLGDGDIRALAADNGLSVEWLDGLICWLPGAPFPPVAPGARLVTDPAEFFDIAAAIGAPMVNAVEIFGFDPGHDAMIAGFSALCAGAKARGIAVSLEFTPIGSIPDLPGAASIIEAAGYDNGGILFDTWHFARSHGTLDQIAAVDPSILFGLQVSDTGSAARGSPVNETMHHRLLPGEGDGRVAEVLSVCAAHGVRRPLSAEVLSDALLALPLEEMLSRTIRAVRKVSPWES